MLSIPTAEEIVLAGYCKDARFRELNIDRLTYKMAIASKRLIRERWFDTMDDETKARAEETLKQLDYRYPEFD